MQISSKVKPNEGHHFWYKYKYKYNNGSSFHKENKQNVLVFERYQWHLRKFYKLDVNLWSFILHGSWQHLGDDDDKNITQDGNLWVWKNVKIQVMWDMSVRKISASIGWWF